jgi:photosystem II stability/assembly factor-like uncharacterized protein
LAEHARLATKSLLLDVARAGDRLVAVGERGHVLLSDDQGRTWNQAESVPTQALLTGVCFSSAQRGVAVGHDEVILVTRDAGNTWTRAHYAPKAQQPLLDVTCDPGGRVIAVGAYGAYFTSDDTGATWQEGKFEVQSPIRSKAPPSPAAGSAAGAAAAGAGDEFGRDFHLNRIVAASATRLYIAAESGHLYRSDDRGNSWHELPSPYEGSFFGVLPLAADGLLAYGLRGNLFRSEDAGVTWRKIETGTSAMLNDVVRIATNAGMTQGFLAAVGLSGVVLVSHDDGRSFALMQQDDRKGLSAALPVGTNTLVTVGEGGVTLIKLTTPAVTTP